MHFYHTVPSWPLLCRLICLPLLQCVCTESPYMQTRVSIRVWGAQAHLLRIVDPMTGQPLTMDRIEDEASILFIAGACRPVISH